MGIKDELPDDIRDSLEMIEAELESEDLDDPIGVSSRPKKPSPHRTGGIALALPADNDGDDEAI